MHHKKIKKDVVKELKNKYPNWNRLSKKEKKAIAKDVLKEVINLHDFNSTVNDDINELLGIENQVCSKDIIDINAMKDLVVRNQSNTLLKLVSNKKYSPYIQNTELSMIDSMLDNQIIDILLVYSGFSPQMREFLPHHFLKAELLKALKYPEISYRKFCSKEYLGMHQKDNKAFIGLPLNKNKIIDHTLLSKFRASLSFSQLVNLLVYILFLFKRAGFLKDNMIHGIDSTELSSMDQSLLASLNINGKKIRIYNDLNCDCGKRRNKKDKSSYVIGYRMHTLTAIDPKTGHSYPLISLLAPANHHDSLFAHPLISLAKAIGIDLQLVTADEAYNDNQQKIFNDTGVNLVTPPNAKASIPDFVDVKEKQVFCNKNCLIPMEYLGLTEDGHEFKCAAQYAECPFAESCPKCRNIPIDNDYFQRISPFNDLFEKAIDIRKNCERPFNLLKNREGLEKPRSRNQNSILACCTFAQIATLLIEIAGTRRKEKSKSKQKTEQLPLPNVA